MKEISYSDPLERILAEAFIEAGIEFVHESQGNDSRLDFYLPGFDLYVEVKAFHSDRVNNQLSSKDNVLLCQGPKSVKFIVKILSNGN